MCVCVCVCVFMLTQLWPIPCDLMDCSLQAPLSMEYSRQEYQSGLPFHTPKDLPDPRIEPKSLASPAVAKKKFFTTAPPGKPMKLLLKETHTHTHTHTKACYLGGMIFKLSLCNPELFLLCFISFMSERFGDSSDYSLAQ